MIPRFLMAAGMAVWLMSNPAGAQGFSGGNPQNATQAAPNVGSNMAVSYTHLTLPTN